MIIIKGIDAEVILTKVYHTGTVFNMVTLTDWGECGWSEKTGVT